MNKAAKNIFGRAIERNVVWRPYQPLVVSDNGTELTGSAGLVASPQPRLTQYGVGQAAAQ